MQTRSLLLLVAGLALATQVTGTVYDRCGVAKALSAQGFPKAQLNDWVCLVEKESSRNTAAKGGPNSDGSYDYGLFQINSRYWCGLSGAGGDCGITCSSLLDSNIANDAKCAKLIYARHGFNAWYGWINGCKGRSLPDVSSCL